MGVDIETDCDSNPDLLDLHGTLVKTGTASILKRAPQEPFIIPPALRVVADYSTVTDLSCLTGNFWAYRFLPTSLSDRCRT